MREKHLIKIDYLAYLLKDAEFSGAYDMPTIKNKVEPIIPKDIVPYSHISCVPDEDRKDTYIHFYMHDDRFTQIFLNPDKYILIFKKFGGIISPDQSVYIDYPFFKQAINALNNRAAGCFFAEAGVPTIYNARWSDKRSFAYCFESVEPNGIYAVSTLGCCSTKEEKLMFYVGLSELIKRLSPKAILVHGHMNSEVFDDFLGETEFVNYPSWTDRVFKK